MNIIKKRRIFLTISATLFVISWALILSLGLKQGIDLRGGAEWQLSSNNPEVSEENIRKTLEEVAPDIKFSLKPSSAGTYIIRLPDTPEEKHQEYLEALTANLEDMKEVSFSSIGPSIGSQLRRQSIKATIAVLLGISLYIAWAFRKVRDPVKSWKYGITTLITLFHDVSIPTGLLALLGWWQGIEIDTNFIVALLVVMGFSVHDTIVVFDRIRENLLSQHKKSDFGEIINKSIKETIARSVNTSITLVFILATLLIWGPASLFYFSLTILVGTIAGTYSSIFLASPLLYTWEHSSGKPQKTQ